MHCNRSEFSHRAPPVQLARCASLNAGALRPPTIVSLPYALERIRQSLSCREMEPTMPRLHLTREQHRVAAITNGDPPRRG